MLSRPNSEIPLPPLLVPPGAGERFLMGSLESFFTVLAEQVGGAYEMHEQEFPPGVLVVPHVHERETQASYVAAGTLGFLVGQTEYSAPAGSCIVRPAGVVHAVWNPGPGPARMLEISSPGSGISRFFRGFNKLSRDGEVTAEAVSQLAAPFGIRYHPELISGLERAHGVSTGGGWWTE